MDPTWQNMISHSLLWFTAVYCEDLWGKARYWQLTMLQKKYMKRSGKKTIADLLGWSWILINPYSPSTFHIKFLHRSKVRPSWNRPGGLVGGMGRLIGNHWFTSKISKFNLGGPNRPLVLYQSVLWFFHHLISVDPKVFIGNLGVFISQAAQALVATVTYCNTM